MKSHYHFLNVKSEHESDTDSRIDVYMVDDPEDKDFVIKGIKPS